MCCRSRYTLDDDGRVFIHPNGVLIDNNGDEIPFPSSKFYGAYPLLDHARNPMVHYDGSHVFIPSLCHRFVKFFDNSFLHPYSMYAQSFLTFAAFLVLIADTYSDTFEIKLPTKTMNLIVYGLLLIVTFGSNRSSSICRQDIEYRYTAIENSITVMGNTVSDLRSDVDIAEQRIGAVEDACESKV